MCSLRKLDTNTHKTSFLSEITRRTRNCYIRVTLCMIELAYRRTSMHLVFSFIAKPQRQRRIFGLRMVFGEETIIVTSSYPAPRQPILLQTSRCRSPSNSVRISLDSDSGKSISCTVPNHAYTQRDFVPRLYIYIYQLFFSAMMWDKLWETSLIVTAKIWKSWKTTPRVSVWTLIVRWTLMAKPVPWGGQSSELSGKLSLSQ